jgi:hypothetical protein
MIGLQPASSFDVETDDEDLRELRTDRGGIAKLEFTRKDGQAVYLHKQRQPSEQKP